jgi:hypothetical protein
MKVAQDAYCERAIVGDWEGLGEYPEDLRWEALVDVVRGRVKVQAHCYEAVDLDDLIRVRFVHAQESHMIIKNAWFYSAYE